jgi:UDP-glucose 4-epimerase
MMVEYMLKEYATAYGLRYVSLRYFNAAGALPDVGLGEYHQPEHHLIPLVLRALYREQPFTVFGNDYDTHDGSAVRDYVHVHDIAHAHLLALTHLQTKQVSEVFNLGCGRGYSVRDIIAAAEKETGKTLRVVYGDRRPGDPAVLVANARKAQQLLGWQPQHSLLPMIIKTALRWEQRHQFFVEKEYKLKSV